MEMLKNFSSFRYPLRIPFQERPNLALPNIHGNKQMLKHYFGFQLDSTQGHHLVVPFFTDTLTLAENLAPETLTEFLLSLEEQIDWLEEKGCLGGLCRAFATFCAQHLEYSQRDVLHHVLFDGFFKRTPISPLLTSQMIVQLTDLHDLYKVFERC